MDIRKRIIALAMVPVLSLFATVALADVSLPPGISANATSLTEDDQIKNRGQCPADSTFFKNAFPSLTNGTPGGSTTIDFTVDGKIVPMTVTWFADNSFNFSIEGGWASRVGVTVDTNNFVYEYSGPLAGIDDPADGFTDSQLNYYPDLTADDVNHLDLCLETLDSTAPDVSIRVEPSSDGTTISGVVSIIATIVDESDVNVTIEIVDADLVPIVVPPLGPTQSGNEYIWIWDTSVVPSGTYTITVDATDTSVFANFTTASKVVIVSIENCLEGDDRIPAGEIGIGGCNPSGFQIVELPEELRDSGLLDGQTLTQYAVPVLSGHECVGPTAPFAGRDPRWVNGVYTPRELDLSEVFDVAPGAAVMRADTRGEPCIALIYGEASFSFKDFYDPNTNVSLFGANRYTYGITQLPEAEDLGLPIPADVAPLGASQIDLQKVPEATYQPTDRGLVTFIGNLLGPFTNEVFNPQRAKVPDFSYYVLGTVQICESLLGTTLTGRPYYDAVLECSTDLAVEYFDDLDVLLDYYGTSSPEYPQACLLSPSAQNLRVELNRARSMIKVGNWNKADRRLRNLLRDIEQGSWIVDDRNCPGHAVMRVENLLWRNAQLDLAESLLP